MDHSHTRAISETEERSKQRNLFPALIYRSFFIVSVFITTIGSQPALAGLTLELPYREAVTNATENVKDQPELDRITQRKKEGPDELPEFLSDLILLARQLEDNGSEQSIVEKYQEFADKWNEIVRLYPDLSELEPILTPIINSLLSGLPTVQSTSDNNPIENLLDLHGRMEEKNPWASGVIWQIPILENDTKTSLLFERTQERTLNGYKTVDILEKIVLVALNDIIVFSESIENNTVLNRMVTLRVPSILHETVEQMAANNEDPRNIAIISEFIELMNVNLKMALGNGIIDDCSYSFMFRKQLNGVKDTCVNSNGEIQNLSEMSKFNPFDHVNQVKLSRREPLTAPRTNSVIAGGQTEIPSSSSLENNAIDVNPLINQITPRSTAPVIGVPVDTPKVNFGPAAIIGIMVPAYLWSIAGFAHLLF